MLSTIAADHTKGLLADHHELTGSLIDGYQVAFLAGAAAIAIGIALPFTLLRPPDVRREAEATEHAAPAPANLEMEQPA